MTLSKVLIAEDSELLHRMYDLILVRYKVDGTKILHAYNGRQALQMLTADPDTDLIILDINMPEMSGLEFLRYRRAQRVFLNIPVIIISTEGKEEDTVRGLEFGARAYLKKPFQAKELHALIERVLAGGESTGAGVETRKSGVL